MPQIRIRNGFSDRNGFDPIDNTIQVNSFSESSRIVIKNKIIEILQKFSTQFQYTADYKRYISTLFSKEVFCLPLDSRNSSFDNIYYLLMETIDNNEYYDVLAVIEFIANKLEVYYHVPGLGNKRLDLKEEFNDLFEEECIGYRFVGTTIQSITNENEIHEIHKALVSPFETKVNNHIKKALEYLSETGRKDYENSIKESVAALEGLCALITNKKGRFAEHIDCISNKYKLHPSFAESIKKIYGYASDEGGIRHENKNNGHKISFNEAKLILVLSCSTINYLISTCSEDLNK